MNQIIIHKEDFDLIKDISIKYIFGYITLEKAITNNIFNISEFVIFTTDDEYYHIYVQSPKKSSPTYKIIESSNKMKALFKYVQRKETLKELDI